MDQKINVETDNMLRVQRDLVEAHIALVKMQHSLLSGTMPALPQGTKPHQIKTAQPSSPDAGQSGQFGLPSDSLHEGFGVNEYESAKSNQGTDVAHDLEKVSQEQNGPAIQFLTKFGASVFLPLILGIMVLALLFRSPRELTELRTQLSSLRQKQFDATSQLSNALKEAQAKLAATQTKLNQTEAALTSTEQALQETQQGSGNTTRARTSPAVARPPGPAPVEAKPISNEQQLAQAQQDLRNIRMALVANQGELIKNLREYSATARALAVSRQGIFQTGLEIRRAKGEISDQELTKGKKSWEDFLSPKARLLMNDPRLDDKPGAASTTANQKNGVHGPGPEDDVLATIPETQALIVKTSRELTAVMKQLTNAEADIIQTQSELTVTTGEQEISSRLLLALQAAPVKSKPGVAPSSTSGGIGKLPADVPDAAAAKAEPEQKPDENNGSKP